MADVTYAEPQKLSDFKPNPFLNIPPAPAELQRPPASSSNLVAPNRGSSDVYARPHNLPPNQTNLRNDGQWRTIDLVPQSRGGDTPTYAQRSQRYNANIWSIKNNGTAGLTAGQSYGRDQAFAELAYSVGFFIDGFSDGLQGKNAPNEQLRFKRSGLEDLSYGLGQKVGDEIKNITKDTTDGLKRTRDELWRNRPTFEIPQLKIPEWDIKLPDIKIPEFEFPPFPQPKPFPPPRPQPKPNPPSQPKTLTQKIRDGDFSSCNGGSMGVVYAYKVTGDTYIDTGDGNGYYDLKREYIDIKEFTAAWRNARPETNYTDEQIIELNGGTGSEIFREKDGVGYAVYPTVRSQINTDGTVFPFIQVPYLEIYPYGVAFGSGIQPKTLIDDIADFGVPGQVYNIRLYSSESQCLIPEDAPPPSPQPPPEPPPEKGCCRMSCCPKSPSIDYRKIKQLMVQTIKEQTFAVDIPITSCQFNQQKNEWEPKTSFTIVEVFATNINQARQQTQIHIENAKQAAELCLARNKDECEAVASLPERYQIPVDGHIPQLICLFREVKEDGSLGDDYYPITIPHPASDQPPNVSNPPLPVYKKGSWEGILTLKDNSKAFVNAETKEEAERMLTEIKSKIHQNFLEDSFQKIGQRKGQPLKEINVKLFRCDYYPTGTKKAKPQWVKYFRSTS